MNWPLRVAFVIGDIDDFLHLIGHLNIDLLRLLQFLYFPLLLLLQQFPPHMSVPELQSADDGAMMAVVEKDLLVEAHCYDVLTEHLNRYMVQTLHGVGLLHFDVVD